jgi:hypothetical protein
MTDRRVVDGVRLPDDGRLTENEKAWIEFIRLLSQGSDPMPTLRSVQALRQVLARTDVSSGRDR